MEFYDLSVAGQRPDSCSTLSLNKIVAVVTSIGNDVTISMTLDQLRSNGYVRCLTTGQDDIYRVAQSIKAYVQFACKASATAAQSLFLLPPFAPAAC